jgi:hypothetical protein
MLQVNDWLLTLTEEMSNDLYRVKGILALHGVEQKIIFQVPPSLEMKEET